MTGGLATFAGRGEIDRHLAARHLDLGVADGETGRVGVDGLRAYRARGQRVAGGGRRRSGHEEAAPRQRVDLVGQTLDI